MSSSHPNGTKVAKIQPQFKSNQRDISMIIAIRLSDKMNIKNLFAFSINQPNYLNNLIRIYL